MICGEMSVIDFKIRFFIFLMRQIHRLNKHYQTISVQTIIFENYLCF